jgi:eukaryotic-like serine/threonine-protein kinase
MIDRIGNCRVIEEIGSGGMAVIYKAVQESLNRTVAIKALKASVAQDSQFAIRFEREALSVSSLQHENIIHIYDFHRIGGSLYIVMEFVEGIDLYDLLDKCAILPSEVAAIVALQVARGLDYAHYRGVIHRDIKPANIMIGKHGGVKLMDFGIARDQAFGDLTETGTGLGTPSYMSPEQILGDKLDFRSDMFSLGIVMYQMLCGRKPFIEDEHKSVMHKIRLEKYPAPRKFNPQIPGELERIMARCLEKRKEDRYKSTQDLVLALERFIAKRVEINYHARLVLFLRDQKVISDEEADAQLHPAVAGGYKYPSLPGPLGWAGWKRLASLQGGILGAMAILLAFVHASQLGEKKVVAAPLPVAAPAPKPPGFLRVLVDPWAQVYVDGKLVETTPFSQALPIPEGEHAIALKNPFFVEETRRVSIKRGATETLKVALVRK